MRQAVQLLQEDCARVAEHDAGGLDALRDSHLLVTGGSGFMAGWIAEMVCHLNEHRRMQIRLSLLARNRTQFQDRLPHIASKPYVTFLQGDVRDIVDLPKDVNFVLHAAGSPDNRNHTTNPIGTMITIADGTRALIQAAERAANLRMILNVSSGNIYGRQPSSLERIPENYAGAPACGGVESAYAEAKRYAETLMTAARSQSRLPVQTVRPFAFLGAYQPLDAPWAINTFLNDALQKRPIRVMGDGQTVRSLLYGADMALWVLTILARGRTGHAYNLGSNQGISLESLARKVSSHLQPSPEVILNAALSRNVPTSILVPDTQAAERDFGLRVLTDLDTAIQRTLKWHQC
ncbi:MAG: NAD-dependent epimerase/dehydratase family protein [Firmicutes bacterium]|nr:NAD-dependent epimerase/dehydratase family protein [Bacillota bacterium]